MEYPERREWECMQIYGTDKPPFTNVKPDIEKKKKLYEVLV